MNHIIKEQVWGCKPTLDKGLITLSRLLAKVSGNFEDVSGTYMRRKRNFTTKVLSSGQQDLLSGYLVYNFVLSFIVLEAQSSNNFFPNQWELHLASLHKPGARRCSTQSNQKSMHLKSLYDFGNVFGVGGRKVMSRRYLKCQT